MIQLSLNHKEWQSVLGLIKLLRHSRYNNMYGRQTRKTRYQTCVLNYIFEITKFPSTGTMIDLALMINIHPKSIQKWFQNTRQIKKKKTDEEEDDTDSSVSDIPPTTLYMLLERAKQVCRQ